MCAHVKEPSTVPKLPIIVYIYWAATYAPFYCRSAHHLWERCSFPFSHMLLIIIIADKWLLFFIKKYHASFLWQGWALLSIVISSFLPVKPKFAWYLETFLIHMSSPSSSPSSHPTISAFAQHCQTAITAVQAHGQRKCKPSNIELVYILGKFAEAGNKLDSTLTVPVYLPDGSCPVSGLYF